MLALGSRRNARLPGSRGIVSRLLRRHRRLSRAEIAQRSGLSEASVSRTVAELIKNGIVEEEGFERSTGGRPAIRLRLSDQRYFSIGVDIRSWEIRFSTSSPSGSVRDLPFLRTPSEPAKTLEVIARVVEEQIEAQPDRELIGVGISIGGLVDSQAGVVELGHDVGWYAYPARQELEERLGLPVFIENNVRAASFAEYHYGSPDVRDAQCLLFVGVQEGIGVSILFDGEVYAGQHMAAGEFGQMVVEYREDEARHDRPGCLEQLASDCATIARYQAVSGGKDSGGDVGAQVRQICHLAQSGDAHAETALRETARYLGVGIYNMVWGLDPDAVIVDGLITEAWNIVGPAIRDQFPRGREFLGFRDLVLRPSALAGQASLVGAAVLPLRELFDSGNLPSLASAGSTSAEARA
ncbi:MAG: ROK family transcriptional regulator [Bryobacterales bacterium]